MRFLHWPFRDAISIAPRKERQRSTHPETLDGEDDDRSKIFPYPPDDIHHLPHPDVFCTLHSANIPFMRASFLLGPAFRPEAIRKSITYYQIHRVILTTFPSFSVEAERWWIEDGSQSEDEVFPPRSETHHVEPSQRGPDDLVNHRRDGRGDTPRSDVVRQSIQDTQDDMCSHTPSKARDGRSMTRRMKKRRVKSFTAERYVDGVSARWWEKKGERGWEECGEEDECEECRLAWGS